MKCEESIIGIAREILEKDGSKIVSYLDFDQWRNALGFLRDRAPIYEIVGERTIRVPVHIPELLISRGLNPRYNE